MFFNFINIQKYNVKQNALPLRVVEIGEKIEKLSFSLFVFILSLKKGSGQASVEKASLAKSSLAKLSNLIFLTYFP